MWYSGTHRKNVAIGTDGTTVAHNTNETNKIHGTLQTLQTLKENYKIKELAKTARTTMLAKISQVNAMSLAVTTRGLVDWTPSPGSQTKLYVKVN